MNKALANSYSITSSRNLTNSAFVTSMSVGTIHANKIITNSYI